MTRYFTTSLCVLFATTLSIGIYQLDLILESLPSKAAIEKTLQSQTDSYGCDVYDRNKKWIGQFFNEHRMYTPANELAPLTISAFLSAEDKDFYTHPGFSLISMFRAANNKHLCRTLYPGCEYNYSTNRTFFFSKSEENRS